MEKEDLELLEEFLKIIGGNPTETHLNSCEKVLQEKDKEIVEKRDIIRDLELELSKQDKEITELKNQIDFMNSLVIEKDEQIVDLKSKLSAQGSYIEDLEDQNFELNYDNKELRELLDLERNKDVGEKITITFDNSVLLTTFIREYLLDRESLNKEEINYLIYKIDKLSS